MYPAAAYSPNPMHPALKVALVVSGILAAGGVVLLARTALAKAPGPVVIPEPTPTPKPEQIATVRLVVQRVTDAAGQPVVVQPGTDPSVTLASDDPRFSQAARGAAFIVGPLPVRVVVTVPYAFGQPTLAEAAAGTRLLTGQPGYDRAFLFQIDEYAPRDPSGLVRLEDYNAVVSGNFTGQGNEPLRIFAVPD